MSNFMDLVTLCRGNRIYIQTHNFPDPDAIASAFGLQKLLESFGVASELCYDGRIDKLSASKMLDAFQIHMLPYEQMRPALQEEDYIICVDTQNRCNLTAAPCLPFDGAEYCLIGVILKFESNTVVVMMSGSAQAFRIGEILKADNHAVNRYVVILCKCLHGFDVFLKSFL